MSVPEFHSSWLDSIAKADVGTVAALVGRSFGSFARVLHPAYRLRFGQADPVAWANLGGSTEEPPDLASCSFFEASGCLLHSGDTGRNWDIEPKVGELTMTVLRTVLRSLDPIASENDEVNLGFWTGYRHMSERSDSPCQFRVGKRTYVAYRSPRSQIASLSEDRGPNLVWSPNSDWLVVSDVDLPSSYVGGDPQAVSRLLRSGLDVVSVGPDTRVAEPVALT